MQKQVQSKKQLPNKYVYVVFLIAAICFVIRKDYSTAIIFGGIGLAFDPFNQNIPFPQRPFWQKLLLISHCLFVFVVIYLSIKNI